MAALVVPIALAFGVVPHARATTATQLQFTCYTLTYVTLGGLTGTMLSRRACDPGEKAGTIRVVHTYLEAPKYKFPL